MNIPWFSRFFSPYRIRLPATLIKSAVERHGTHVWHYHAYENRTTNTYLGEGCLRLANRLSKESSILETGCGIGLNLFWLKQRGFNRLNGFDLDPSAIEAGREISEAQKWKIDFWTDDGLKPQKVPVGPYDGILALNWTMLISDFALETFLKLYSGLLRDGGLLAVDLVDSSYNLVPDNQYLTSDWSKPVSERQPTEYKTRFSHDQVQQAAARCGFSIMEVVEKSSVVQRKTPNTPNTK